MRKTISKLVHRFKRWWSAYTQPMTSGLIRHGDWRCRYKDNEVTHWMSHGDADNLRQIFGGTLEWRYDDLDQAD